MSAEVSTPPPLQKAFAADVARPNPKESRRGRSRSRSPLAKSRVAALQRGFSSFTPVEETSTLDGSFAETDRLFTIQWPKASREEAFYVDTQGAWEVLGHQGLIRPGVFYKELASPLSFFSVVGLHSGTRRTRPSTRNRCQALTRFSSPHRSPPRRRYFHKKSRAAREDDASITYIDHSSWMAMESSGENFATADGSLCRSELNSQLFLPLVTATSQFDHSSKGSTSRETTREALHARCRQTPEDPEAWLRFAEFQWPSLQEELGAPPRRVREKQRAILETALESCPGNVKLLRAAACAEGDECAGLDAATIHASRRARLLACGHAEAAEELVWTYIEGSTNAYGEDVSPVDSIRKAALDSLGVLAARKIVAGHDGRACMALERAELAAISATAFADAASGNTARALALLRAQASQCVFFPSQDAEVLRDAWTKGCRLGDPGALFVVQGLMLVEAAWQGFGGPVPELPPELAAIAELLENSVRKGNEKFECRSDLAVGSLASLLKGDGGRMCSWVAEELLRTTNHTHDDAHFDDISPFLVNFRGDVTRREAVLRYLDALGSPSLARHLPATPYRNAFSNVFAVLDLPLPNRCGETTCTRGVCGGLVACADRAGLIARSCLQSLVAWPKDYIFLESLLASLWDWGRGDLKLPRRVLRASDDPRLFFEYAWGLWRHSHYDAARAVFLKLCSAATGGADARVAIAWWHLEILTGQRSGRNVSCTMPPRAFRVLCALAKNKFDANVLSSDPLCADAGLQRLQAIARLEQSLASQSQIDAGGFRMFISSYHAVLVAVCALIAWTSPERAFDIFLQQLPTSANTDYTGQTVLSGKGKRAAEEHRCNSLATGLFIEALICIPLATPRFIRHVVWNALQRDSKSTWLLKVLAALHLQYGRTAGMRRDLDRALHLHRHPCLVAANCTAAGLRVALEAELCSPDFSADRLVTLCARASEAGAGLSPFSGALVWAYHHMALLLKAHVSKIATQHRPQQKGNFETRWRVAVRAVQRYPFSKALWLLQLAAWEARSASFGGSAANEEEVVDLIEAMEAGKINLLGDPLEAVA